jgi:hypothetical protein
MFRPITGNPQGVKVFDIDFTSVELCVPTNALRQFLHCFRFYKDAPIRISAVILPSSGGILSEFLHRPILWLRQTVSQYLLHGIKFCKISGIVKLLKVIKI